MGQLGNTMKKKKSTIVRRLSTSFLAKDYVETFTIIKQKVEESQVKAVLSVNTELLKLYWFIGKILTDKQESSDWGAKIIERLAQDLQRTFPGIEGFSRTNIFRIRSFYVEYQIVPQAVGQFEDLPIFKIPWGHNVVLIEKVKDLKIRLWYAQKTIENGWSRSVLEMWIKSDLYRRDGKAITNFKRTLPMPQSDMAQQSLKDPYIFDFLTLHEQHVEHDIEQGLIENVQKLLLELGKGFALVGRQYHLEVGNKDYYIDLLFYHFKLDCFVVVELKAREFDPRDAGQLNFYLTAVDEQLRGTGDKPTIGLLLCKSKNSIVAEYALRDINKPIGVAEYETAITKKLPKKLESSLPTIKELEAEFAKYTVQGKKKTGTQKRKRK